MKITLDLVSGQIERLFVITPRIAGLTTDNFDACDVFQVMENLGVSKVDDVNFHNVLCEVERYLRGCPGGRNATVFEPE